LLAPREITMRIVLASIAFLLASTTLTAEAQQPAPRETGARADRNTTGRGQGPRRLDWWNDEGVAAALKLTAEQRKKADTALADHREPANTADVEEARARLSAALIANDKAAAKAAAADFAKLRNRPFEQHVELTLAVMAVLEPSQRQLLGSKYPQLLTRGGGMQRPAGQRARPAAR
jgi:Spy/CpxP family protein refolding chaperone